MFDLICKIIVAIGLAMGAAIILRALFMHFTGASL